MGDEVLAHTNMQAFIGEESVVLKPATGESLSIDFKTGSLQLIKSPISMPAGVKSETILAVIGIVKLFRGEYLSPCSCSQLHKHST